MILKFGLPVCHSIRRRMVDESWVEGLVCLLVGSSLCYIDGQMGRRMAKIKDTALAMRTKLKKTKMLLACFFADNDFFFVHDFTWRFFHIKYTVCLASVAHLSTALTKITFQPLFYSTLCRAT